MEFGPDGKLYVVSSGSIKKYGPLGKLLEDSFISGLRFPDDMEFGPDGKLYVVEGPSLGNIRILQYDSSGTLMEDSFISGLDNPSDIEFGPNGKNLYISDKRTIKRYAFSYTATE